MSQLKGFCNREKVMLKVFGDQTAKSSYQAAEFKGCQFFDFHKMVCIVHGEQIW